MATIHARRRLTIALPPDLAESLDAWAEADWTSRSSVVARLVQAEKRRRFEAQLEQDYRDATADGFYDGIEFYFCAQAEAIGVDPD